jgi:hypothetical protein
MQEFSYIIGSGVVKPGTCYKVTEEIATPNLISNLRSHFDNGGTDFLKRRYKSNRLKPQTTEDNNLDSLFIRISNLTKVKARI